MRKYHWIVLEPANFTAYFLCLSLTTMLTLGGSQVKAVLEEKNQRHNFYVDFWRLTIRVAHEARESELDDLFLHEYEMKRFPASSFNGHVERDTVIRLAKEKLTELLK